MEVALGLGSLVLLAGGITALLRRSMTPGQGFGVLALAVMVAGITLLGDWVSRQRGLGGFYVFALTATITVAGMLMAVAVVARPPSRSAGRGQ